MTDSQREALLLKFLSQLKDQGSWCGETHIQKSTYFLQEFTCVPLGLNYIFYKHGPFSFELNDLLTSLRGNDLVVIRSHPPYGPHLHTTVEASEYMSRFPKTIGRYELAIKFVVDKLASKNVAELERLATALYLRLEMPDADDESRAREMNSLKPHVTVQEALAALQEVEEYEKERVDIISE